MRHHDAPVRHAAETVVGEVGARFLELPDAAPENVVEALVADHMLDPRT